MERSEHPDGSMNGDEIISFKNDEISKNSNENELPEQHAFIYKP